MRKLSLNTILVLLCIGSSPSWAKSFEHKVQTTIDDIASSLKEGVDSLGNDVAKIRAYLHNCTLPERATSGPTTLHHMQLNDQHNAIVVKAGETVEGQVEARLDPEKCSSLDFYRVVLGLQGVGGQTTICNYLGASAGTSLEKFTLKAPHEPGVYQIRFRTVHNAILESSALDQWKDSEGKEPDPDATIGFIVVRE